MKDFDITTKRKKEKKETYNIYKRYIEKHYNEIIEDFEIGASVHQIKRIKTVNTHFNNALLNIQILSMSKRIMNEVMCFHSMNWMHLL